MANILGQDLAAVLTAGEVKTIYFPESRCIVCRSVITQSNEQTTIKAILGYNEISNPSDFASFDATFKVFSIDKKFNVITLKNVTNSVCTVTFTISESEISQSSILGNITLGGSVAVNNFPQSFNVGNFPLGFNVNNLPRTNVPYAGTGILTDTVKTSIPEQAYENGDTGRSLVAEKNSDAQKALLTTQNSILQVTNTELEEINANTKKSTSAVETTAQALATIRNDFTHVYSSPPGQNKRLTYSLPVNFTFGNTVCLCGAINLAFNQSADIYVDNSPIGQSLELMTVANCEGIPAIWGGAVFVAFPNYAVNMTSGVEEDAVFDILGWPVGHYDAAPFVQTNVELPSRIVGIQQLQTKLMTFTNGMQGGNITIFYQIRVRL